MAEIRNGAKSFRFNMDIVSNRQYFNDPVKGRCPERPTGVEGSAFRESAFCHIEKVDVTRARGEILRPKASLRMTARGKGNGKRTLLTTREGCGTRKGESEKTKAG